jgi:hypothetical protein
MMLGKTARNMSAMPGIDPSQHSEGGAPRRRAPMSDAPPGSKVRASRLWAIRSSTILIVAAAVLCLFVIWNRDRNTSARCLRFLDPVVKHLRDKTREFGAIPAEVPDLASRGTNLVVFDYRFGQADRYYAMNTQDPVIIAYTRLIPLQLRPNGRCVIIYQDREIRSAWLDEGEFSRQWKLQSRKQEEFQERMRSRPVELPH